MRTGPKCAAAIPEPQAAKGREANSRIVADDPRYLQEVESFLAFSCADSQASHYGTRGGRLVGTPSQRVNC